MALQTPVITVLSVTVPQKSLFRITFKMTVVDSDTNFDGIDTSHSINVRPGDNVDDKVAPVIVAFQKEIDDYQAGVTIQGTQAMADAITAIGNGVSA